MDQTIIRLAIDSDLPALGQLGALLLETHYRFDQKRFMAPHRNSAEGYPGFFDRNSKTKRWSCSSLNALVLLWVTCMPALRKHRGKSYATWQDSFMT